MAEEDPTEQVTIQLRSEQGPIDTRDVSRGALPFFLNQGYQVLDSRGRVSGSATSAAKEK